MAHTSLKNHAKLFQLADKLGIELPQAVGHLTFFWWSVNESLSVGPDGHLDGWNVRRIEHEAQWVGVPGAFVSAMLLPVNGCSSGFLRIEAEVYVVNDYWKWAPDFVRKRWERNRKMSGQSPDKVPTLSGQSPDAVPTTQPNPTHEGVCENVFSLLREGGLSDSDARRLSDDPAWTQARVEAWVSHLKRHANEIKNPPAYLLACLERGADAPKRRKPVTWKDLECNTKNTPAS